MRPRILLATARTLTSAELTAARRFADEAGLDLVEPFPLDASVAISGGPRDEEIVRGRHWIQRLGLAHLILLDVSDDVSDHPLIDFVAGYALATGRPTFPFGEVAPWDRDDEPERFGPTDAGLEMVPGWPVFSESDWTASVRTAIGEAGRLVGAEVASSGDGG